MPTLYTYCIPVDDGAAPNPFWGVCTLAICKPAIRRNAQIGDWIVGTGSRNSPIGDCGNHVVYAMRVTDKMTIKEYDGFTRKSLKEKMPECGSQDIRRRLGDSIYDFSTEPPTMRPSVHTEVNRAHDLGGKYVLLSEHFFYFGNNSVLLPQYLHPIVKQTQGHRSHVNIAYVESFIEWLHSLGYKPNTLIGKPQWSVWPDVPFLPGCKD